MVGEEYERRILLVVSGLSPQVVTETIYALTQVVEPRFVPTEVHLVTTAEGAERARLSLLSKEPGWFGRLCRDYGLSGMEFSERTIHVLRGRGGGLLSDIRSSEENAAAADFMVDLVRRFTGDSKAAVHGSLAGGRKTLGALLGFAMSLYGRPQDRLSHVLVSAPYESHPSFFYPTATSQIIYTAPPDSRPLDTAKAEVSLAEIPFLRVRHWLGRDLLESTVSYSEAVAAAQRRLEPGTVVIGPARERWIKVGEFRVVLPPAEWAFYAWFARRAAMGGEAIGCPSEGAPEGELAREYLAEYRLVDPGDERTPQALRRGMDKDFFLQRKSRVRRILRRHLGAQAGLYEIRAVGKRPETRYRLEVAPEAIRFEQE